MQFNLVVCGGTFDHFHKGHRELLRLAFSLGEKIIVGVTSDKYVEISKIKNQKSKLETYEERNNSVLEFLKAEGVLEKTETVEINDLFGPTLNKDLLADAIVVSESTKDGAYTINKRRVEIGLPNLQIIVQPMIKASDGKEISSFRIRNGIITREGMPYVKPLWLTKDLFITDNLREILKKPFGRLFDSVKNYKIKNCFYLITVGDATTKIFNKEGIRMDMAVVDFRIARKKEFSNIKDLGFVENEQMIEIDNPSGSISSSLTSHIYSLFGSRNSKIILKIEGEEDLAVLPLILAAPLGSLIFYGQPNEGIVEVEVSEESKKNAYNIVDQFEKRA